MRASSTQLDSELSHDHTDDRYAEPLATQDVVGSFAVGQSVHATYEVYVGAPVGSFASGLASDMPVRREAPEPVAGR
jgi:hypothetical protein